MTRTLFVSSRLWLLVPVLAGLIIGCGSPPAEFRFNLVEVKNQERMGEVTEGQQKQIANALRALFGTPDNPDIYEKKSEGQPSLLADLGFDLEKLRTAAGPVRVAENSAPHGLYRKHCAHCHGVTGDGAGPTASFLNPYPRDYRPAIYKFKITTKPSKPTRGDLDRILINGVAGTSMPSFRLLPKDERDALIEYVKYLSVRGEMEIKLIRLAAEYGDDPLWKDAIKSSNVLIGEVEGPDDEMFEENILAGILYSWDAAEDQVIQPVMPELYVKSRGEVTMAKESSFTGAHKSISTIDLREHEPELAASIERGRDLFLGKGQCFTCHGVTALGDGQVGDYSDWFRWRKDIKEMDPAERDVIVAEYRALGAHRPRNIIPRNLRLGIFRGGNQPISLYQKIYTGINGTPMPGNPVRLMTGDVIELTLDGEDSEGETAQYTVNEEGSILLSFDNNDGEPGDFLWEDYDGSLPEDEGDEEESETQTVEAGVGGSPLEDARATINLIFADDLEQDTRVRVRLVKAASLPVAEPVEVEEGEEAVAAVVTAGLRPQEIWDIVNYVLSVPHEELSQPPSPRAETLRDRL